MIGKHTHPGQGTSQQSPTIVGNLAGVRLQLRRQWYLAVPLLLLPVLFTGMATLPLLKTAQAAGWLLLASPLLAGYFLFFLYQNLDSNRLVEDIERLLPTLGAANWLTLGRASAVVALSGFLPFAVTRDTSLLAAWSPGLLYMSLSAADLLDGWIARRQQRETLLGRQLDMTVDAAGLLVASLLAILLGRLPVIYLLVGLAYYLFRCGIRYRQARGLQLVTLQSRPYARIIAGFQMGLVGVALLPLVPASFTHTAAVFFMVPLLAGFLRDWLVVSASLATDEQQRSRLDHWVASLWEVFLPPLLRILLLAVATAETFGRLELFEGGWQRLLFYLLVTLAASGCLARLAALGLAVLLAFASGSVTSVPLAVFSVAILLLLTGPGGFSVWAPEEAILYRRRSTADQNLRRGR